MFRSPAPRPRRWLALVLALALFAVPAAAFADEPYSSKPGMEAPPTPEELLARARVTREQAISTVAEAFAFPAEWPDPTADLQPMGPVDVAWHINWQDMAQGRPLAFAAVNAVTGDIMWMNREDPRLWNGEPVELTVDRAAAAAIAEALLQRLRPAEFAQTRPVPPPPVVKGAPPERAFWFAYNRLVSGIPFPEHSLSVTVSAIDGTVLNYGGNWADSVTFVPAEHLLDRDQALAALQANPRAQLVYHRVGEGPAATYVLVYVFGSGARANAVTGEVLEPPYPGFGLGTPVDAAGVQPRARGPITTADAAAQLAREVLGLDPEVKPVGVNQWPGDQWRPQGTWNVDFQLPGLSPEQPGHASVGLEADTGRIVHMWSGLPFDWEKAQPTIGEAEAEILALDLVRRHFGPELDSLRLVKQQNKMAAPEGSPPRVMNYMFNFNRVADGIPVENEGININVSAVTGRIENVWINWGTVPLPPVKGAMSPESADRIWWDRHTVELTYTTYLSFDGPYVPEHEPRTATPIWQIIANPDRPAPAPYTLANSGRFVDWQGAEVFDPFSPAPDIAQHPARATLEFMAQRRALEPRSGLLRPGDALTRMEAVILLVRGMGPGFGPSKEWYGAGGGYADVQPGHPYFYEIQQAVSTGILPTPRPEEQFGGEQPVTRTQFTLMLGRALGLGLLEQVAKPLPVSFSDARALPAGTQSMLAVLVGLGVVPDSSGAFQGDSPVTRADAAMMVERTHHLKK